MKIKMLETVDGPDGNKLTEGRVYNDIDDKFVHQLVKDKKAEEVKVADHGIPPDEVKLAVEHEDQSIIADPDMSQNENPIDRPHAKPDPDMSKARTAAVVEAKEESEPAGSAKKKKK